MQAILAGMVLMAAPALTPADDSADVHRVHVSTGVTLEFSDRGPPGAPVVILLHGLGDARQSFDRLLPRLPDSLRVVAIDLRGHGGSTRPATGYSVGAMAADVVALAEALDLRDLTVVGHSLGSFVAREVARRLPGRTTGLILLGSAAVPRNAALVRFAAVLRDLPDTMPPGVVREFQRTRLGKAVPSDFFDRILATSGRLPTTVWRQVVAGLAAWGDRDRLAALYVPTMVIVGDRDVVVPDAEQVALFRALPLGELRLISGVGHAPHWEAPNRVAAELLDFMHRHRPLLAGSEER